MGPASPTAGGGFDQERARASSSAGDSSSVALAGAAPGWWVGCGWFLVADTPTSQEVAEQTGGRYDAAEDAEQLGEVFSGWPKEVARQRQPTEMTWLVATLGALLTVGAIAAPLRRSPYP